MVHDASLMFDLVIPGGLWESLQRHLFPGDSDEHGAVIAAGFSKSGNRVRLLACDLFLAQDGVDYLPGQRGYRMLTAPFVRDKALYCRDEKLAYLAIHNHDGMNSVEFSEDDLRSHVRGYPALQDITRGQIVGGLVFAQNAVAGDLWLRGGRATLRSARVIGPRIFDLHPTTPSRPPGASFTFDRQARLFGDRGQEILRGQRVGVIGLGGVGSLVCEYLARLGVGEIVLVDPDRIDPTNLPRVVGSTSWDARSLLRVPSLPKWIQEIGAGTAKFKVDIARREAKRANASLKVVTHRRSVIEVEAAADLTTCDFLFLAADSMQARHVFNALVNQYLIPGVQLGAKVPVEKESGEIGRVYSVVRPVLPRQGCLWCNGFISPAKLQEESLTERDREAQRYVDEPDIPAPSVITLNAVTAAHAVNDYLFRVTGLRETQASDDFTYFEPRTSTSRGEVPRTDLGCLECGSTSRSRFARGDLRELPIRGGRMLGTN